MGERKGGGGQGRKEIAESLTIIPVQHKGTNEGRCVLSTDGHDIENGVS